jgi:hypothetical protein
MQHDEEPAELAIGLDKVRDIVLKAREFELEAFPDDDEPGADPGADSDREELLDQGEDPTEEELRQLLDDLNEDETIDLIALAWVGRGDFGAEDWEEARSLARDRGVGGATRYVMGMPTLADYLCEGLAALGHNPEALEPD